MKVGIATAERACCPLTIAAGPEALTTEKQAPMVNLYLRGVYVVREVRWDVENARSNARSAVERNIFYPPQQINQRQPATARVYSNKRFHFVFFVYLPTQVMSLHLSLSRAA